MVANFATLQLHRDGSWHTVGELTLLGAVSDGHRAPTRFEYDVAYASGEAHAATDYHAVSVRLPVTWESADLPSWPPFLLDLLPQGAQRRTLIRRLGQTDGGASSDWALLLSGADNPPGNLRVAEAASPASATGRHLDGFSRAEVVAKGEDFIDYAEQHGAPTAGTSGAQGEAPKFLLRTDHEGRFHADGALPDGRTSRCLLVKFPRGSRQADRLVLQTEGAYWSVARWFGLRVHEPIVWEADCLFVPRFDRRRDGESIVRLGLESLASAAGLAEFGAKVQLQRLLETLRAVSSRPDADAAEFLRRDVLNVALGNTDNHPRNFALLKDVDGTVRLSPLYDMAPMFLDPAGVSRTCRWRDELYPAWPDLAAELEDRGLVPRARELLRSLAPKLGALPEACARCGVPEAVLEAVRPRIARVLQAIGGEV